MLPNGETINEQFIHEFKTQKNNFTRKKYFWYPKKFELLTQSEKIASLQFHLLEIGTLSKKISVRNISIACRHLPKLN